MLGSYAPINEQSLMTPNLALIFYKFSTYRYVIYASLDKVELQSIGY